MVTFKVVREVYKLLRLYPGLSLDEMLTRCRSTLQRRYSDAELDELIASLRPFLADVLGESPGANRQKGKQVQG